MLLARPPRWFRVEVMWWTALWHGTPSVMVRVAMLVWVLRWLSSMSIRVLLTVEIMARLALLLCLIPRAGLVLVSPLRKVQSPFLALWVLGLTVTWQSEPGKWKVVVLIPFAMERALFARVLSPGIMMTLFVVVDRMLAALPLYTRQRRFRCLDPCAWVPASLRFGANALVSIPRKDRWLPRGLPRDPKVKVMGWLLLGETLSRLLPISGTWLKLVTAGNYVMMVLTKETIFLLCM